MAQAHQWGPVSRVLLEVGSCDGLQPARYDRLDRLMAQVSFMLNRNSASVWLRSVLSGDGIFMFPLQWQPPRGISEESFSGVVECSGSYSASSGCMRRWPAGGECC